ncbi:MAG: glutamine--tRNA ligase/YqeY domain fusion protein, partial [Gracilibacteraceae bacterium]|nr:glutamine--tRNA ligase/YqeY domain fusion protein [Gracilibacteraceae bacterium]
MKILHFHTSLYAEEATLIETPHAAANFIHAIIREDLRENKNGGRVHTRFPPEPNGYLHIGHAKSICLNFGAAVEFDGKCNLRFDDTNPAKEDTEYVDSIQEDVRWLGFDWEERLFYASDYFPQLFDLACRLIEKGLAYVCELSAEEIRAYRGTLTMPGRESPYRERSVEQSRDLFLRMKAGEFPGGAMVLRAKIDMASPNLNMRDPVIYRILHQEHHRTGDNWCIYPMYDFAHPLSDAIEGITHSICTMEFEDHRPLYDWLIENLIEENQPKQYEFARLDLTRTVMSKRKLRQFVEEGAVSGWDDPRMPTISGLRRRGYTPEAIRDFCERIGVAKANSVVDVALLEYCAREDLNRRAPRRMLVLSPLKIVIDNYPADKTEYLEAENHPDNAAAGTRLIPFGREIYIEREDFMEDPPKKYFRLRPGGEVRLKHAYIITCTSVVKDETGRVTEVHCLYDPLTKSGGVNAGRKVKGTLHWVAAREAVDLEARLYDHLLAEEPAEATGGNG